MESFRCTDLPKHPWSHHHVLALMDTPSPEVGRALQTLEVHQFSTLKEVKYINISHAVNSSVYSVYIQLQVLIAFSLKKLYKKKQTVWQVWLALEIHQFSKEDKHAVISVQDVLLIILPFPGKLG